MNTWGKAALTLAAAASSLVIPLAGHTAGQPATPTQDTGHASTATHAMKTNVTPLGVGTGVHVIPSTTWIFQCAASNCNHGSAAPGDDLADVCYVPGQSVSFNGITSTFWDLVWDRKDSEAGLVPEVYLDWQLQTTQC